jgi:hypothetical protein
MRINEVLSEAGAIGTVAKGLGVGGAGIGQALGNLALKGMGLNNTANAQAEKGKFGAYSYDNASELVKQLGIKPGMDFEINPGEKVKITKVDNAGATYIDRRTGLPLQLGKDALIGLSQRQQALQTVAQIGKPGAPNEPATAPTM